MSNNYPKKPEVSGNVRISENVICSIAKVAALDVDGVKAAAEQHVSFFRKQAPVSIAVVNDMVEITMRLVLKNGYRLTSVAEQVQKSVKNNVQSMTGVIVSKVHVIAAEIAFDE
ncbi:MAG: Asp23/Gls24 family envelope stress response protein [Oscillospiraceae bacterium]|nr:Asp23/Gls24 family envelope stress response protein [Oscillospiraceae bacterium]